MKEQLMKFQEQHKDPSSPLYKLWRELVEIALKISEKRFDLACKRLSGDVPESKEYEDLQKDFSRARANLFSQCQKVGIDLPDFSYRDIVKLFPLYP